MDPHIVVDDKHFAIGVALYSRCGTRNEVRPVSVLHWNEILLDTDRGTHEG